MVKKDNRFKEKECHKFFDRIGYACENPDEVEVLLNSYVRDNGRKWSR